jgi:hypothetical protein
MPTNPCDLPLVAPENDPCAANQYVLGAQITSAIMQDPAATTFPDLTSSSATMAAITPFMTAVDNTKTTILKNLAGAKVPAAKDTTLSGNDVTFGGTRITNRERTITARLDFITPAMIAQVNAANGRQKPVRLWLVDDKGVSQGPCENATVQYGSLIRDGINGGPTHVEVTITYNSIDEPQLGAKPLPGLNFLVNA